MKKLTQVALVLATHLLAELYAERGTSVSET